jgi:acetyltransferase-like isoleucine patch superfamily enzyme
MFRWRWLFQRPRVIKYKLLSDKVQISGKPIFNQPVLMLGKGNMKFGRNVQLGYYPSPFFYSGYIHLEVRSANSAIVIGDDVYINNNFCAISEGEGIFIGSKTLIGFNCEIIDSDFHGIKEDDRNGGNSVTKKVILNDNVFLGNNVKIMKGVELGKNVVVANGAVVVDSFPENVIIGGVPAKIIGKV